MIGRTVSHFRIVEKLGEGGMGVVYRAEDTKLGRTVALKFPSLTNLSEEQDQTRFLREAQAAASLSHPNVCTVHDIYEVDGQTFIAMELVEGRSLKERLRERPLPLSDALDFAAQAADGLAVRTRRRHRPSRHQEREPDDYAARPGQDHGLRPRSGSRPQPPYQDRHDPGHGRLYVS